MTGLPVQVAGSTVHIRFGDETGLAELAEALEALERGRAAA